jgi:hypothetical protein
VGDLLGADRPRVVSQNVPGVPGACVTQRRLGVVRRARVGGLLVGEEIGKQAKPPDAGMGRLVRRPILAFRSPIGHQAVDGMTWMLPSNARVAASTSCPSSWTCAPCRNPSTTVPSMITAPVTLLRTPLRWAVNDSAPASMIQSNSTCQICPEQGFGPVHPVRTVDAPLPHADRDCLLLERQLERRRGARGSRERESERQQTRRHEADEGRYQ